VVERVAAGPRPGRKRPDRPRPSLRFSPAAWAKLQFFRDRGETEIGGFGIAAPDDLLLVQEFVTVRQIATAISVEFDDAAVADFFESQVDAGRKPEQFARLWCHTHPGSSPIPSGTDEHTFMDVFGRCDWAVMFILAQGGKTHARLRFNVGPGGQIAIPTLVDFAHPFPGSDQAAWAREYDQNIQALSFADWGIQNSSQAAPSAAEEPVPLSTDGVDQRLLAALECGLGLDEAEACLDSLQVGRFGSEVRP
jgi:hypothetical protein